MTRTYYYIVYRKPRGRNRIYAGDGLVDADTVREAKETVAHHYKASKCNVKIRARNNPVEHFPMSID